MSKTKIITIDNFRTIFIKDWHIMSKTKIITIDNFNHDEPFMIDWCSDYNDKKEYLNIQIKNVFINEEVDNVLKEDNDSGFHSIDLTTGEIKWN